MKIFILLLLGVSFSEQSFWFERAPTTKIILEPTETVWTSTADHRFIVNVLKYKIENETESPTEFACLGTLIAEDYAVVPADCVHLSPPYLFAIQFIINQLHTNEIGPSIILKRTEIEIHENYSISNNETNNIALVKFFPQGISIDPPIFENFAPILRSSLPQLSYCSVIGSDIYLSSPPEEKVLINGPGCCGTSQAHCTVFEDANHDACKSLHGAPVICGGKFSGFVLKLNKTCVSSNGRIMMKYHSVGDFTKWIEYYVNDMETTTAPTPGTASSIKLSLSFLIFIVTSVILN